MRSALIPCLRYADAPAAILFLCDAFGFMPQAIHLDEEDQQIVRHAQLLLDGNMVMLGSADDDDDDDDAGDDDAGDRYGWRTPAEAGGVTMTVYATVADPDGHCAIARANGAEIVAAPHDNDGYPGREYTARDREGHVWTFGSYDPFAPPPADA